MACRSCGQRSQRINSVEGLQQRLLNRRNGSSPKESVKIRHNPYNTTVKPKGQAQLTRQGWVLCCSICDKCGEPTPVPTLANYGCNCND